MALVVIGIFLIRYNKNFRIPGFTRFDDDDDDDDTQTRGLDNPMYDVPTGFGEGDGGQYGTSGNTLSNVSSPLD